MKKFTKAISAALIFLSLGTTVSAATKKATTPPKTTTSKTTTSKAITTKPVTTNTNRAAELKAAELKAAKLKEAAEKAAIDRAATEKALEKARAQARANAAAKAEAERLAKEAAEKAEAERLAREAAERAEAEARAEAERIAREEAEARAEAERIAREEAARAEKIAKMPNGFVFVEGGTIVGSGDKGAFIEGRTVKLSDFYMGKTEVTRKLYKEIMSDKNLNKLNVSAEPATRRDQEGVEPYSVPVGEVDELRPVEFVSWYEAVYFCNLLSKKEGLDEVYTITGTCIPFGTITEASVKADFTKNGYRLPTSAEWEYAARGGKNSPTWNYKYAGVDSSNTDLNRDSAVDKVGWYRYNTRNGVTITGDYNADDRANFTGPHEVGKKAANILGLYDMCGNVFEWCHDNWERIEKGTFENPGSYIDINSGRDKYVVGGCWNGPVADCNVFQKIIENAGSWQTNHDAKKGFRLCRSAF